MKQTRTILLTFDHELFLGERSGDVNSCMLEPTQLLQEIFSDLNIQKAIYFLDTTYVSCLKRNLDKEQVKKDYQKVKSNIQFLLEKGHYVFPHIHPHWLDANYLDGDWILNKLDKYTFSACSEEERTNIWKDSIAVLKDFGVLDFHEIDSFRAGGWSIQPFQDFKPFFDEYQIKNDFSVLPGTFSQTNAQRFDFTEAPQISMYRFQDNIMLQSENGDYYEFPISTRESKENEGLIDRAFRKYLWKTNNRSIGKGLGVIPKKMEFEPAKPAQNVEMISIELLHALNLKDYKRHLDENEVTQFISHPKMLSKHNIKIFRKFMKYASQNYNLVFDFKSLIK